MSIILKVIKDKTSTYTLIFINEKHIGTLMGAPKRTDDTDVKRYIFEGTAYLFADEIKTIDWSKSALTEKSKKILLSVVDGYFK